ncbi:potassium voltage-gated channel protein Shaw-like [Mercenaria mercenaria]|uniref:potassium voltage-gated channel protein Shaw-like n=1 Tax=Mercenaria mercenaria TaxID=6596 RepID=UPI001E1D3486|nr:potassium voltage-gated channel protein Shaw-like [Mercenaria mercenaria]
MMQNGRLRPEISIESEKIPLSTNKSEPEYITLEEVNQKIFETQLSEEEERIVLNVGGVRHETHVSTLQNIPDTRLSNLAERHVFAEQQKDVYFFDRHPAVFNSVIDFYRTGELHVPLEVCGAVVKRELDYWQINENHIKSCCWRTYRSYIENKRILDSFNRSILKEHVKVDLDNLQGWKKFQTKVWLILEHPRTSRTAMVYGVISLLFVVVSISGFCLETLPQLKPKVKAFNTTAEANESRGGCEGDTSVKYLLTPNPALQIVDTICTIYFTIELIVRFTFALNKRRFVRSAMNIIDLLALVPLYMQLILNMESFKFCFVNERLMIEIMFILRIIRMFRIFHLVKHYQALQILVYALKASIQELLMLGIFLLIGMLVFATMIYYAERKDAVNPSEQFTTIPIGFWWAIITMTTLGYGDIFPTTPVGYVVGASCAVSGVLLVALTFPVISNNFTLFYTHVRSRSGRIDPNKPLASSSSDPGIYESDDEDENKLLYQNARRTSNGSIILNNRSFVISRNVSGITDVCSNVGQNCNTRSGTHKDASSMMDVIVKRDDSSLFTRTSSVKAHSDDGVTYTAEPNML